MPEDGVTRTEGEREQDVFKDTYLRFLGYTNEIGEAFRPIIPRLFVNATYAVAAAYAIADSADKALKAYHSSKHRGESSSLQWANAIDRGFYTCVWQMLASVLVPPIFVNRGCATAAFLLRRYSSVAATRQRWISVAAGLSVIPFIVSPIDNSVHWVMDRTYSHASRKVLSSFSQKSACIT